jgi:signal transduction histidine kinase
MLTYTFSIAKTLMMDLLDLAQMENNTFRINNDNFSLLNVIEDAFRVVKHYADQKKVKLVAPDLPEDKKIFFKAIHGDKNRF